MSKSKERKQILQALIEPSEKPEDWKLVYEDGDFVARPKEKIDDPS